MSYKNLPFEDVVVRFLLVTGLLASGCASHGSPVPTPIEPIPQAAPAEPTTVQPEASDPTVDAIVMRRREGAKAARDAQKAERSAPLAPSVVEAAELYLRTAPSGFRDDCSGFVCAVYAKTEVPLRGNTQSLWAQAKAAGTVHKRKRPHRGDLAFYDNTYDRNRNGRLDDELTHIAVVVDVEDDGTIVLAHRSNSKGRSLMRMNLERPTERHDGLGSVLNDYLRGRTSRDPSGTGYLAGEMWRAFATVRPSEAETWDSL